MRPRPKILSGGVQEENFSWKNLITDQDGATEYRQPLRLSPQSSLGLSIKSFYCEVRKKPHFCGILPTKSHVPQALLTLLTFQRAVGYRGSPGIETTWKPVPHRRIDSETSKAFVPVLVSRVSGRPPVSTCPDVRSSAGDSRLRATSEKKHFYSDKISTRIIRSRDRLG